MTVKRPSTATRVFRAGQAGAVGGVEFRIVAGRKLARRSGESDLRIDLRCLTWVPIGMDLVFLLVDFLCENEDVLFPPEQGYQGGQRLLDSVYASTGIGWEAAADNLRAERDRAAAKRKEAAA